MYYIRNKENGAVVLRKRVSAYNSLEAAEEALEEMEREDKADGWYEPNHYIVSNNTYINW